MKRFAVTAWAVVSLLAAESAAAEFAPRPAKATLKDTERTYPRIGVEAGWYPTHRVGDRSYRIEANTVFELTDSGKSESRKASVAADFGLNWLGAADGIAFLVADRDMTKGIPSAPDAMREFHRLDLNAMKWLDPFKLPEPSIKPTQRQLRLGDQFAKQKTQTVVLAERLLVTPKGIVVLSAEVAIYLDATHPAYSPRQVIGYHVCCYEPKDMEAKWKCRFHDDSNAHRSLGYAMVSYDDSIERLNFIAGSHTDDLILVCPGQYNAVVCLTAGDGKIRWRIPAIWEYERGFIGPSVFEHYIERFGLDYNTVAWATGPVSVGDEKVDKKELQERIRSTIQARSKLSAARKAFYARYQGRMTAGPIVALDTDQFGTPKIYIAATRSLKPEPGGADQPEHALLYEIDLSWDRAEITAMTRLPRPVIGTPHRKVPGGFVLSCDKGAMVRLRTYEPVFGGFMGPGRMADDLALQVDWYREFLMQTPAAWLVADPAVNVAGFSKVRLFRPSSAYILKKEDGVYQLQINVVDLRTGLERNLILSVPFEGSVPIPETGLSSFNRGTPSEQFCVSGPHLVWIDRLALDGRRLTVVVAHGSLHTALHFDLSAMLADE